MKKYRILAVIIGILGFAVIIYSTGWALALGILLVTWGNNLERDVRCGKIVKSNPQ